jgi:hypothetical protein
MFLGSLKEVLMQAAGENRSPVLMVKKKVDPPVANGVQQPEAMEANGSMVEANGSVAPPTDNLISNDGSLDIESFFRGST